MLNWLKMSEQRDENSFQVLFHNVQRELSEKNVTWSNWVTISPLRLQLSFFFPAKPPNCRKWHWNSVVPQVVLRLFPSLNNEIGTTMDAPNFELLFFKKNLTHMTFIPHIWIQMGCFQLFPDGVGGVTDCPAAAEVCDGWASSWFLMNTAALPASLVSPVIEERF